eukprot:gene4668-9258_t
MENLASMNRLLSQPDPASRHKTALMNAMQQFTDQYANPNVNMGSTREADDMRPLLAVLRGPLPGDFEVLIAKVIKILLRKPINRTLMGKHGVLCIVKALMRQTEHRSIAATEIGNVVLNTCYNGDNVQLFIDEGGFPHLLKLLLSRDTSLQASVLGAIQGICFVPIGRQAIRQDSESIRIMVHFLDSEDSLVRARASGTIHNISADSTSILILREAGCIPSLVRLLRDQSVEVCQAVTGTLQNLSREVASREIILECDALPPLSDLLLGNDVQCQVAAVGALFNLLSSTQQDGQLSLRKLLTECVVMGALQSCLFDTSETPEVGALATPTRSLEGWLYVFYSLSRKITESSAIVYLMMFSARSHAFFAKGSFKPRKSASSLSVNRS